MVEKAPESGSGASSSLTALVPRQVMLDSCSVVATAGAARLAEKKAKKRRKGKQETNGRSSIARAALLRAIASFLEGSGFTRTLAALRSDAQLELSGIDDGSPVPDLEEIICKYLELSKDPVVGNITGPEDQDAQDRAPKTDEGSIDVDSEETVHKKRKRKVKCRDDVVKAESVLSVRANDIALPNQVEDKLLKKEHLEIAKDTAENQLRECNEESKGHKKKKSKKVPNETTDSAGNEILRKVVEEKSKEIVPFPEGETNLLVESNVRSKEKKKKSKLTSEVKSWALGPQEDKVKSKESGGMTDSQVPTLATENGMKDLVGEDIPKSKDKKKRKHKLIVESSNGYGAEAQNGPKFDGEKKGKTVCDVEYDVKESRPKTDNILSSADTENVDKKVKKRKRSACEESELNVGNDVAVQATKQKGPGDLKEQKDKEVTEKLNDALLDSECLNLGKKRKTEKPEENSEKSAKTLLHEQSQVPDSAKEINAAGTRQNENKGLHGINGNHGKNEQERIGSLKSTKAGVKNSVEPKTVNAFQRVKIDEVKFADEKLQDNSYWAKGGAETGYGAKAQDILGQVRGRDFRHEKTKKKRGSYRGGQIDFQSHSVKFNYSDDE